MLKKVTILTLFLLTTIVGFSQICTSGSIGVSGPGCGCFSGCDLSALGGPNCGGGTLGNCSAGHITMSTTIVVPATCQVQITAEMKNRPSGCSASGADGNSTSGDRLRVRNSAGPIPPWQTGSSNASLFDQLTVTGPATIFVEGAANRADEIITYTVTNTGTCSCSTILPINLVSFSCTEITNNSNLIEWSTSSEINNNYFTVETSTNALEFNQIGTITGAGNSNSQLHYKLIDDNPISGINYYRLKQTDFDGSYIYSDIISINNQLKEIKIYSSDNTLIIKTTAMGNIDIFDVMGKIVYKSKVNSNQKINLTQLKSGIYIYRFISGKDIFSDKFIIP